MGKRKRKQQSFAEKVRLYYKSNTWKEKRKRAFEHHGDKCQHCSQPATHIHCLARDWIFGREKLEELIPLCIPCYDRAKGISERDRALLNMGQTPFKKNKNSTKKKNKAGDQQKQKSHKKPKPPKRENREYTEVRLMRKNDQGELVSA